MKRICINALIMGHQMTGLGALTRNLLNALFHLDSENEYIVFLDRNLADKTGELFPNAGANVRFIMIATRGSRWLRVLFEQLFLPFRLLRLRPQIFFNPAFTLPFFVPGQIARIVYVHDMFYRIVPETFSVLTRLYYRIFFSSSINRAERIFVNSESTRRDVLRFFPDKREVIKVVFCALYERPRQKNTELVEELAAFPYIFCLGRIEKRKNLGNTLRAFRQIKDILGNELKLIVGGFAGYGKGVIQSLIKELALGDDVIFSGYIADEDLWLYYRHAELFLFVSLYEGFGLPILEAMAEDTPVVTSNTSAMPEVGGEAVLYVDPESPKAIAGECLRLLEDEELRKKLVKKGRKNLKRFSWEKSAARVRKILESELAAEASTQMVNNEE